jgi:hypothetical protein
MSNKQIKNLIDELYKIDESLKDYGPQLEKIIAKIIEAKPDVKIDEQFKEELYKQLMVKAGKPKPAKVGGINVWQQIFSKKLSYAFMGAVAIVVIMFGVNYFVSINKKEPFQAPSGLSNEFNKVVLSDNAFGSLAVAEEQGAQELDTAYAPVGRGGEGTAGSGGGTSTISAMPEKIACMGQEGCIIPPNYFPEYVYVGEDAKLEQDKMEVLRRKNKIMPLGILETFDFGLTDLSAFKDAKIQTINFVQDKPYGYTVFINFDEGTISIDAYWPKWPQPYSKCADEKCYESMQLDLSDLPADEELIAIANRFIAEHGIDLKNYGQPEIENEWRNQPGILKAQLYVPDYISLVYPLLINGKFVYEQSGTKFGVRVGINIREKKVSGLYNLSLQEYESSMYETETDFSRILEIAEKGGMNGYYYWSEGQSQKVEIGTPSQEYLVIWKYDQEKQINQMLIVPALIFPVTKTPTEGYYYSKNIIVPLVKELLEEREIPPYPMPLMEKAQ